MEKCKGFPLKYCGKRKRPPTTTQNFGNSNCCALPCGLASVGSIQSRRVTRVRHGACRLQMTHLMTLRNVPLVGTPSAECCSKSKFSPCGNLGFISNSRGTVVKSLFVLIKTISLSCVPNSTEWLSSTRYGM
jgi:hypothetical protein